MADLETIRTAKEFFDTTQYDEMTATYARMVVEELGVPAGQVMTLDTDADSEIFDKFMPLLEQGKIVKELKGGNDGYDDKFFVYFHQLGKFIYSETRGGKLMAFWIPKKLYNAFLEK